MRINMKYLSTLILVFIAIISMVAQDSNNKLQEVIDKNIELYNLDVSQKVQYIEIANTKYESYNMAKANDPNFSYRSESLKKADKVYEEAFLSILNDEQKKIYQQQKAIAENAKANQKFQSTNQMNIIPSPVIIDNK